MAETAVGVNCDVLEWVKRESEMVYGMEKRRMLEKRLARKVYQSSAQEMSGRVRPPPMT